MQHLYAVRSLATSKNSNQKCHVYVPLLSLTSCTTALVAPDSSMAFYVYRQHDLHQQNRLLLQKLKPTSGDRITGSVTHRTEVFDQEIKS
mmetsp:Transcript_26058/g.52327  ORF Transcript_26058/g.52327 Transcript_26058/m.52327 type:complete len:90 (-) Transcript_26058:197-466(-)